MKRIAIALALAALASPALANGDWAFNDPYWKQQLSRTGKPTAPARVAAGPQATMIDAGAESRAGGTGHSVGLEAEHSKLERAGFPQYTN
jgi:hypothetical protein